MIEADARFSRQILFPPLGRDGQRALGATHVVLVGLGAVGASCADLFCRAGFGALTLVDRDVVEESNLPRQTLYDLSQALAATPKAEAARVRLAALGGPTVLRAVSMDAGVGTAAELRALLEARPAILCDATDNYETRFFLSDLAVEQGVPLAYAGAIGGRAAAALFAPPATPCMRCLFPEPPAAGTVETCDTAGVIGPAAHGAAALVVAMAMKHAAGATGGEPRLVNLDVWGLEASSIPLAPSRRDPACRACGTGELPALWQPAPGVVALCGRGAFQVNPSHAGSVDLAALAERISRIGSVASRGPTLRATLRDARVTVFADGRALVEGVPDAAAARKLYAEVIGS